MSLVEKDLQDLAEMVFSDKYEFLRGPHELKGKSGKTWRFDAIVKSNFDKFGVFIRDWKREISITQLRQLHRACVDTEVQGGILICNMITDFSRDYSDQFGIQLISKGHLISKLRNKTYQI
jgi:hypothetical protein